MTNRTGVLLYVNPAFARYSSPQIAEYVLGSPEGELQGGESREVTILMSDLRDFTGMGSGLEPDRLVLLVNHYFEAMVEIIEKRNGTGRTAFRSFSWASGSIPVRQSSEISDPV